MKIPSRPLIDALLETADRLERGAPYQWTHQGRCNCGHLVQSLTHWTPAEIHAMALETAGEWSDKAFEACPSSGFLIDHVVSTMLAVGLSREDIRHLEYLSDPLVRQRMGVGTKDIERNRRDHVVAYMRALASLLEERWRAAGCPEASVEVLALLGRRGAPSSVGPLAGSVRQARRAS